MPAALTDDLSQSLTDNLSQTSISDDIGDDYLSFSFSKFGDKKHGLLCEPKEFRALIKHLKTLSQMTWTQVDAADRHGLGYEKLPSNQIKEKLPANCDTVLSFRYSNKKPFIGVREKNVFNIYYIDPSFDLYDHE